jgi:hypothetical protein
MSDRVIVTKNESVVAWLRDKGINAPHLDYATGPDVLHKQVYGLIPYWMASYADCVYEVTMRDLSRTDRDRFNRGELTVQEMDAAGAELVSYRVRRL